MVRLSRGGLDLKRRARGEGRGADLSGRLVTVADPDGAASEAYRNLRAGLLYPATDASPRVIALTSPGDAEGKSTTCANLGVVLARAGKSTLILDCDLRDPAMHKTFGLNNSRGLADALAGERDLDEAGLHETPQGPVVLTAGAAPRGASWGAADLLGSEHFADLVGQARRRFDYVLLDGPPVGRLSEAATVAARADGALLVLDARSTRKEDVRRAMRALTNVGANVLGTVMNNVGPS